MEKQLRELMRMAFTSWWTWTVILKVCQYCIAWQLCGAWRMNFQHCGWQALATRFLPCDPHRFRLCGLAIQEQVGLLTWITSSQTELLHLWNWLPSFRKSWLTCPRLFSLETIGKCFLIWESESSLRLHLPPAIRAKWLTMWPLLMAPISHQSWNAQTLRR